MGNSTVTYNTMKKKCLSVSLKLQIPVEYILRF